MARIAVVGGGISGLAAAHRLRTLLGPDARIEVLEQRDRIGGVLHTVDFAGVAFDVGAEAFLARRPEVPALLAELGLTDGVVHPTGAAASVRAAGRTGPLPPGTLLGVPTSAARLDGLLSATGLAAVTVEPELPLYWEEGGDVALGGLLRARFGAEIVDRLADPLLGGVYAGRVDTLGLRATVPALAAALDAGAPSLTAAADTATQVHPDRDSRALTPRLAGGQGSAARESRSRSARVAVSVRASRDVSGESRPGGPVFGAVRGGYRVLLDTLVAASSAEVRLCTTVRELRRREGGWRLVIGPTTAPEVLDVDAVVLAVPAPAAARLLAGAAPEAAKAAGEIELASSVVVALAFRAEDATALPPTSGVLVAADEPLAVKAFTHSSNKWAHLAEGGLVRLRASLGRFGEAATLQVDDAELVARARADLGALTGITAAPVATHVQRWGGGLPQYGVGHLDRVRAIEEGLPAGVAVAGAALHGVGVPACIATGRAAAERVVAELAAALADGS
ncbi:protoporphyrinogen oxidase [Pseudonocardia sp. DSM 110487]|nr:protoporphyrinogen oxidase [Pseudonocardia sp. DSM 110487]